MLDLPAVWGVHSISKELFDCIRFFIPSGSNMLEFGSGWGTSQLGEHYKLWSVEDKERFMNLYPDKSTYIYAPRVDGWYDMQAIRDAKLPKLDAVLVDGHDDDHRLVGIKRFFEEMDWSAIWFFDDLNITTINMDFEEIMRRHNRPFLKYQAGPKPFGVVLPAGFKGEMYQV